MRNDQFGYETSFGSPAAVAAWDRMVLAFLAHSAETPGHLGAVLAEAPDHAGAHAVKGLLCMMLCRPEMVETARAAQDAARLSARRRAPVPREAGYVRALDAWLAGHPSHAVREMEGILARWPEDALATKIGHAIRFMLGDRHGMRRSLEAVLPACDAQNPALGYLLGCHAFALEETGDYARAESAGRRALGLAPDDAWGLHAVAHVYDMTCDSRGGLDWLEGREAAWEHCNNFRYHVWWHKALMHLDQNEIDAVFELYDTAIRRDHTDDFRDISNATSLLMRLELEGHEVGHRWDELADISERRTGDACLLFADLHYMLALIGGGRETATRRMARRFLADAQHENADEMTARMAEPGLAAARGLEAFGEGDYKTAFVNLKRARGTMQLAGGSHAQRDVFERLTVDAALRAGSIDSAEALLTERARLRAGRHDRFAATRLDLIAEFRADSGTAGRLTAG
jgi:tetratricopeptide (TPR) repeat protein